MVKKEGQASIIMRQVSIIKCIFYGIYDLFFSVWVSCHHFHPLRESFSVCIYRRSLMMNEPFANGSRNLLYFFIIKTSIRVNKGAGFLDLLLNISFQPLIIVVKHSIIKLDVTELLDPPQVFTCWESQWLFCFINTIFVLKVYFSLSKRRVFK